MTVTAAGACPRCNGTGIDPNHRLQTMCRSCTHPDYKDLKGKLMEASMTERRARSVTMKIKASDLISVGDRFQNSMGAVYLVTESTDTEIRFSTEGIADSWMVLPWEDVRLLMKNWTRLPSASVKVARQRLININNELDDAWRLSAGQNGVAPDPRQAAEIIHSVRKQIDRLLYEDQ
jgi:hypothetical protein